MKKFDKVRVKSGTHIGWVGRITGRVSDPYEPELFIVDFGQDMGYFYAGDLELCRDVRPKMLEHPQRQPLDLRTLKVVRSYIDALIQDLEEPHGSREG